MYSFADMYAWRPTCGSRRLENHLGSQVPPGVNGPGAAQLAPGRTEEEARALAAAAGQTGVQAAAGAGSA
jgi:hypothetical protein